jgi:glutathione S-transferase
MKYYDSIGPNPRAVRIAMAEKALSVPTETIDIMTGANRTPEHVARNPSGSTPALELDNGVCIAEITAIIEYLEEVHPNPPIIGATPEERAETRMWVRRIDLYILEPMANGFRATEGRRMFSRRMTLVSEAAAAELKALAQEKLMWLDGLMAGRQWVCGDRYTMADILLLAFVEFGAQVGQPMPAAAVWLPGWHARAAARPSAAA